MRLFTLKKAGSCPGFLKDTEAIKDGIARMKSIKRKLRTKCKYGNEKRGTKQDGYWN